MQSEDLNLSLAGIWNVGDFTSNFAIHSQRKLMSDIVGVFVDGIEVPSGATFIIGLPSVGNVGQVSSVLLRCCCCCTY